MDIDAVASEPIISRWDFRVATLDSGFSMRFDPQNDSSTWLSSCEFGTLTFNSPEKVSAEETRIPFQVLPADVCLILLPRLTKCVYTSRRYTLGATLINIITSERKKPLTEFESS
ncbi:MAG TPA: hypothetical protein VGO47_10155 [Chlamydiales bacterium]|nr:hypothetical protein [Chlamydiales bacterium]